MMSVDSYQIILVYTALENSGCGHYHRQTLTTEIYWTMTPPTFLTGPSAFSQQEGIRAQFDKLLILKHAKLLKSQ